MNIFDVISVINTFLTKRKPKQYVFQYIDEKNIDREIQKHHVKEQGKFLDSTKQQTTSPLH